MVSFLKNLLVLGILGGTAGAAAPGTAGATAAPAADTGSAFGAFGGSFGMIAVWVAIIGVFYFFTIRPQSKRDKKLKEMQSSIKSGDNVLTTSGFYGKVADVGEDCFVIEFGTNRGIRIPVRKSDIVGIQTPKMSSSHASRPESEN